MSSSPFTMRPEKLVQFVFVGEIPNQAAIATGKALLGQRSTACKRQSEKAHVVRPKHDCHVTDQSSGYDAPITAMRTSLHRGCLTTPSSATAGAVRGMKDKEGVICESAGEKREALAQSQFQSKPPDENIPTPPQDRRHPETLSRARQAPGGSGANPGGCGRPARALPRHEKGSVRAYVQEN